MIIVFAYAFRAVWKQEVRKYSEKQPPSRLEQLSIEYSYIIVDLIK